MKNRLSYSNEATLIELRKVKILFAIVQDREIEQASKAMCGIIRMKMLRRLTNRTRVRRNERPIRINKAGNIKN